MSQRVLLLERTNSIGCALTDLTEFETVRDAGEALARFRASEQGGKPFQFVVIELTAGDDAEAAHLVRRLSEDAPSVSVLCVGAGEDVGWDRLARRTPLGSWIPVPHPGERGALRAVLGASLVRLADSPATTTGEFLADASAALREPADELLRLIELVRGEADITTGQRDALLAAAGRTGEQLTEMIDDLLDIAQIEAGRHELERRPCSPAVLLEHAATCARPSLAAHGRTLVLDIDEGLPHSIDADPIRLGGLLMELVTDAAEHPLAEHIRLTASCEGNMLEVRIAGADPEGQDQRLAIASRFASVLGGTLEYGSAGSTTLRLPITARIAMAA